MYDGDDSGVRGVWRNEDEDRWRYDDDMHMIGVVIVAVSWDSQLVMLTAALPVVKINSDPSHIQP